MTREDEPDSSYTRMRAKVQVGDGPDQRGDRTVEMVRLHDSPDHRQYVPVGDILDEETIDRFGIDPDTEVPKNDRMFAEFYLEMQRTTAALRDNLGIEQEEEE